ncbi:MAG TPA: hypothetical protein VG452_06680, partial [Egibacteraceae bacterium]|nr:hypothetical protein [Egibacteraceae bacterium]
MRARMLMLLVPALVAAMVGVGLAALGPQPPDRLPRPAQQPPHTVVVADPSPSPLSASPSDPPTP